MSGEIFKKLAMIMKDIPAIPKNQKNSGQGFMFRGIDDFYNAIHPMLVKYHIFCVPEVIKSEYKEAITARGGRMTCAMVTMKYTYFAEDGSSVSCSACAEAMDSGDKATSKAMAIAHKYALMQTFCVPVEELTQLDPDNYSYDIKNVTPARAQKALSHTKELDSIERTEQEGLSACKIKNIVDSFDACYSVEALREKLIFIKSGYESRSIKDKINDLAMSVKNLKFKDEVKNGNAIGKPAEE